MRALVGNFGHTMNDIRRFKELAGLATEKLSLHYDVPDIIPYTKEMVVLARSSEKNRNEFISALIDLWEDHSVDEHVIEFCCHALKWPQLKNYFLSALNESKKKEKWNEYQSLAHIVESFDPNWGDASDFYSSYFSN